MGGTPAEPSDSQSSFLFLIKALDVAVRRKIYFLQARDWHLDQVRRSVFDFKSDTAYCPDPLGMNAVIKPSIQNLKFYLL